MNILYLEFPENFNGKIKSNIGNKSITEVEAKSNLIPSIRHKINWE